MDEIYNSLSEREKIEVARGKRKLGGSNVGIELKLDDYADAIEDAKIWLGSRLGKVAENTLPITAGLKEYRLPTDVDDVIEVIPPGTGSNNVEIDPFSLDGRYTTPYQTGRGGNYLADIVIRQQANELSASIYGNSFRWDYNKHTRMLSIFPSNISGMSRYRYLTYRIDIEQLNMRELELFRRCFIAHLKRVLGLVRRKFSEIPMGGSKTGLDGDSMSGDAETEFSLIEDDLKALAEIPSFIVG